MKEIVFVFRKSQDNYFSIEHTFSNIIEHLPSDFQIRKIELPYYSRGIWGRIKNIFFIRQIKSKGILHITGDIHYISIFCPPNRTILTIHDCVFLFQTNFLKRKILWFFWYYLPITRLKYITTISEFTKSQLIEITGVSPEKIKVIHNPARTDFHFVEKEFDTACPTILQVGTTFNKNIINVSKALSGLKCKLIIIGRLNTSQEQQLASDNISYENFYSISDEDVRQIYLKSDLLLFVSTYEGFGLPVIEAQITGRPVITSNGSSLPEIAGDGAIYVDPFNPIEIRNAIDRVISDNTLRNMLIEKGRENAKRFHPDAISMKYSNYYNEILSCVE